MQHRVGTVRRVSEDFNICVDKRLRLYSSLIISTMIYGCCAWILTKDVKKKVNGVNSKMLAQITRRTIHEEARSPSVNAIHIILKRRWEYLGHILRLDEDRAVRRYLLELSPQTKPFKEGTLLADASFNSVTKMVECASDKIRWKKTFKDI